MITELQNSRFTARIDSVGAQLISLTERNGQEYIWQRDPAYWTSCSPLLFPTVGNCRDGKTMIDGVWYSMPKHGVCRSAEFQVEKVDETQAVFTLRDSETTRQSYPYAFRLSLTYTLQSDGLYMDYTVENSDKCTIHYEIGAHPGFRCPMEAGTKPGVDAGTKPGADAAANFEDYLLEFDQEETAEAMKYDIPHMQFDAGCRRPILDHTRVLPLSYELFADDALFFDSLKSRKVSLIHAATGKGVEVSFPDFETVAFWTAMPSKGPFLCVEPWNGSAIRSDEDDHLEHRHYIQSLNPGESRNYHLGIRIL